MKDYNALLLQGLSARLNTYELKPLINLSPKHYLRGQQASNINQNISKNNIYNNGDNINPNIMNQNYEQNQMIKSVGDF